MAAIEKYGSAIGTIKDFPQKGIVFRDVSPLLRDAKLREQAYDDLAKHYIDGKIKVDIVAGIESRGFIFGTALAARLNAGFVMIRKPSKLPGKIVSVDYGLEYGKNTLCLQAESIQPKQNVLIVDDLLATGGSAEASIKLIQQLQGNVVGTCFMIELDGLDGRKKLSSHGPVFSLLNFPAGGDNNDNAPAKKEEPKKEEKKSEAERKKEQEELEKDERSVVVYYPTMKEMANNLVKAYPDKYRLGSVQWDFFPDAWPNIKFEHMKFLEGRHVVFLGSLYDRTKLIEQLSLIMVLPRQFVQSLDIVLPYFAPATMERVDEEGILATAETVAKLVTTSIPMTRTGPASLRIFDIHALPVRFYFPDNVMLRLLTAIPLLIQEIGSKNSVVCFPDDGAAKRFKKDFSGFPIIICAKVREGDKRIVKVTDEINFTDDTTLDHVIIVDDLVQSGGTLYECRKALLERGAKKVSAFVTHPVFPNQGYKRFFEGGDRAGFDSFYVTNTIPEVSSQVEGQRPFKVIKVDNLLADDIEKLARHNK